MAAAAHLSAGDAGSPADVLADLPVSPAITGVL
jgi:hypothetical protein